jgi:EAL domain-containing protein (putative c-di-GMP-specific phosphodiesterase class I)
VEELHRLIRDPEAIGVVFQPIASLANGNVVAYEALARFPTLPGIPIPAVFAHAGDLGLGAALEAAAIRRALEPIGRPVGTQIAVNVSPSLLASPEVAAALPDRLDEVIVEVTEHELVAEGPTVAGALRRLRERGARIAIDDTGVGYSGLQQLVVIEPDVVKLDRELVSGIHRDDVRIALVEAVVRFSHRIGVEVCAEGIEDLEDLAALADLDADCGQGFALARPAAQWTSVSPVAADVCRGALDRALRTAGGSGGEVIFGTRERGLESVSGQLASARSATELEGTLDAIASALGATNVTLSRWLAEERVIETLAESGEKPGATRFPAVDYPLTGYLVSTQEAVQVLVNDPTADPAETKLLLDLGHTALLMVPVVARGKTVGLLEAYRDDERAWTRAQINHARIIANQFASVVEAYFRERRLES